MTIKQIIGRQIVSSLGKPTIEIAVTDQNDRTFLAQVPSGESAGSREVAAVLFPEAYESVKKVSEALVGKTVVSVSELDKLLLALDDSSRKETIGGNVLLGVSVAATRALADEQKKQPWQMLREEFFAGIANDNLPLIFSVFIEGGAHGPNNIDIQEYMVVVKCNEPLQQTVVELAKMHDQLGEQLAKNKKVAQVPVGAEAAYCADFANNFEPIKALNTLLDEQKSRNEFSLALDVAASEFFKAGKYQFEGASKTADELLAIYQQYVTDAPRLLSIEDSFEENDTEGFTAFHGALPNVWSVGDDLTTSNAEQIKAMAESNAINAVIIKPNQIGSVSETCQAILAAQEHGVKVIVSHRGGETEDPFIMQIARACGADAVKIGPPKRERAIKFNELIRVFDERNLIC